MNPSEEPSDLFYSAGATNGSSLYDDSDCKYCPDCHFESDKESIEHHRLHVQLPNVTVQRLKGWFINKWTTRHNPSHAKSRAKCVLAKKHTQPHSPIKLTLKLAAGATSENRSFEVVPRSRTPLPPTVLFGPCDFYTPNGFSLDGLKLEFEQATGRAEASVEGAEKTEEAGEVPASRAQAEEAGEVPASRAQAEEAGEVPALVAQDEEREAEDPAPDETPQDQGARLLEEVCRETADNLNQDLSSSDDSNDAQPSPTPSEQLRPDFLAPVASPTPSEVPAMVEQPQPSPEAGGAQAVVDNHSFETLQWSGADVSETSVTSPTQDVDPLQLPNEPPHLEDSLLRSFLSEEKTSTPPNAPVIPAPALSDGPMSLGAEYVSPVTAGAVDGMGAEYMSLERLGERCEVCGERAASRQLLDEHRCNAAHYKCNRPECGSKVFPNSEELAAHLRNSHPAQFARPPMVIINQALQSPPVQQLQQQVQRMPMPQTYLAAPQTVIPLHMQQRRPPPLYPATGMPQQQVAQYSGMVTMAQMYGGQVQYRPVAVQPAQYNQQQQMRPQQAQYMQQPMAPQQPQQQRMPQQRVVQQPRMATPQKRPPQQMSSPQAKQRRLDVPQQRAVPPPMMNLPTAITLSVRQPSPAAVTVTPIAKSKTDAKAVANVLASRGITVTPAASTNSRQTQRTGTHPSVAALNLNSAISIIATGNGSQQQQQGGFAVPQNRSRVTNQVERPPRPPTVDLTGDAPMNRAPSNMRGRMRGRPMGVQGGRHTCQVCDKAFSTEESLQQHMILHRSPNKLPYRCSLCTAQYPTHQGLLQHRQTFHKEPASGPEIALPVVDLKQPGVLQRLSALGIMHYVPLSQLSSPQGGYYGLPIVSLDGARDPAVANLGAMGASNILSLGPLKQLPR